MPAKIDSSWRVSRPRWPARLLWRAGLDARGATMLEFAFVALPLLFLLFGIIELGLIFVANSNLSNAVLSVARQVRLGNMILPGQSVTTSSGTQIDLADFKTAVCRNVLMLSQSSCTSNLQVDVRVLSSFASAPPNPISGTTFSTAGFCFYSGSPGSTVSIRVYLLWPVVTPLLLPALASITNVSNGSGSSGGSFFVLQSDEAFINEPNGTASNTGNGC